MAERSGMTTALHTDEQLTLGIAYTPDVAHVRLYRDPGGDARPLLRFVDAIVLRSGGMNIHVDARAVQTMSPWAARQVLDLWGALEDLGLHVTADFGRVIPLP